MVAQTYSAAIARVFVDEGGYTNDAADPGGPTNWGITIEDARMYWKPDASADDVRRMPKSVAEEIYRKHYAEPIKYDMLPAGVDYAVLDYGINSGISRAAKVLQRLTGAVVDGKIGLATITAVHRADPATLVRQICDERLSFLQRLKTWPVFGRGWGRRVSGVKTAALGMVGTYPTPQLPPVAQAAPAPAAPRDVVEKSAKGIEEKPEASTLPKSKTVWGGIVQWLVGVGGAFTGMFQYIATPWGFAAFALIVVVISVGLYLVIKGRLDIGKVVERLREGD